MYVLTFALGIVLLSSELFLCPFLCSVMSASVGRRSVCKDAPETDLFVLLSETPLLFLERISVCDLNLKSYDIYLMLTSCIVIT